MTTAIPKRIQRKRVAGYKLPANTICCTRPGLFSNPFPVGGYVRPAGAQMTALNDEILITRKNCLVFFEEWARQMLEHDPRWLDPLRNADFLACWCRLDDACHVDVILRLLGETANQ